MTNQDNSELLMNHPTGGAFWRLVLGATALLSLLAVWGLLERATKLGVDIPASLSWQVAFAFFLLLALLALLALILSFTALRDHSSEWLERTSQFNGSRAIGAAMLTMAVIGSSLIYFIPAVALIVGGQYELRLFIFWIFSLMGMWGLRMVRRRTSWVSALVTTVLCQSLLQLVLGNFSGVTAYPFSMGWSETSRYYYPSLFLSKSIYGKTLPWPLLHPTLHLLLIPPYWFAAPLWIHRLWRVLLGFVLIALIARALTSRLQLKDRLLSVMFGTWILLFLFIGPIYFHLAVPVLILLWSFSAHDHRRTFLGVVAASIWAGWSRINWYPVPGMLAALLYFFEVPRRETPLRVYLLKPFLWSLCGSLVAFVSQRMYISLSGIGTAASFYTSFTSDILWYRLLPNATYALGILPGAILVSLPLWLAVYSAIKQNRAEWHPVRITLVLAPLFALFVGGLFVSLKIGGGADLHNLDAYWISLLLIAAYIIFSRYQSETRRATKPFRLNWALALWIAITPTLFLLPTNAGFKSYDANQTIRILKVLQVSADRIHAEGGEILFISQRHLISMHMLHNITLVPEYEREELMEMAMAGNLDYLNHFRLDMQNQRFALIIVDPLSFHLNYKQVAFGEENNVWVRQIMRPILCNYRLKTAFPEDSIALYVPQVGERQCPHQ